jgi:uncharacterized protein (DUF488 family)
MKIFTIGFTKKNAEQFFETLKKSGVKRVIDIRLNNISQLAGFAKKKDLAYFLAEICGIAYVHEPLLAPTREILDAFKKNRGSWQTFEEKFLRLMAERKVETQLARDLIDSGCLLCSEDQPLHCHRRLVAEYLKSHWIDVEIQHLD